MSVWALVAYIVAVLFIVVVMVALAYVLGERHYDRRTAVPYEAGALPLGSARIRLSARFYLVAVFFVVFDLESVFIYAWAVAGRELGWAGYFSIVVFIVVLLATLAYLWRVGALDWNVLRRHV